MKIFLVGPSAEFRHRLKQWLEETRGHLVVGESESSKLLFENLARYEPDAVILPYESLAQGTVSPEDLLAGDFGVASAKLEDVLSAFPDCLPLVIIQSQYTWANAEAGAELEAVFGKIEEASRTRRTSSRCYADKKRYVFHDAGYMKFKSPEKLHRPPRDSDWKKECSRQEMQFVLQFQTARTNERHERAKRYLALAVRFNRGLRQEIAYRIPHNSYKIGWLRDQISRWLTVLAHYIHGVDIDNCPPPQHPSPEIAYLHYRMPAVYIYPLICVLKHGLRQTIGNELAEALKWEFSGESESDLVSVGLKLFGISAYLEHVAREQIAAMDQFLDLQSDFHSGDTNRSLRRSLGVFHEFWGWDYLHHMGSDLAQTTRRCHVGTTYVKVPPGASLAPSIFEVRAVMAAQSQGSEPAQEG